MNLANLGLAAMNAAQNRLNTVGHNLNNADTDGYNRQTVLTQTAGARATGAGYIGRGVEAVTVQRSYDNFLYRQLTAAQSTGAAIVSYGKEISQINNLIADPSTGISPAMQKFFDGLDAVASMPADPAARQELLGRAGSLVGQINNVNAFLDAQRSDINTQITTVVTQINSYLDRINNVNQQILTAKASGGGHTPNDLLDQRDQLVTEINELVNVNVFEQNDGTVNLTIGNGQMLLGGGMIFPLHAKPADADSSRIVVAYSNVTGPGAFQPTELDDLALKGGSLGGLLTYRIDALDAVQNDLGRLAVGLWSAVNQLHNDTKNVADGGNGSKDINGNPGVDFFRFSTDPDDPIHLVRNERNAGSSTIAAAYTSDPSELTGKNYQITYKTVGGVTGYFAKVLGEANAPEVNLANQVPPNSIGGVQLTITGGAPAIGDSWRLEPTSKAADRLELALTDPALIAAADADGGTTNGAVALELAKLRTGKALGNMSLNESYSQLVNKVAVKAQANATSAKAQHALIQQNYAAQQAVSGVNIEEELMLLQRYQDQFRAASRMIDTASTLFDTLLSLRA